MAALPNQPYPAYYAASPRPQYSVGSSQRLDGVQENAPYIHSHDPNRGFHDMPQARIPRPVTSVFYNHAPEPLRQRPVSSYPARGSSLSGYDNAYYAPPPGVPPYAAYPPSAEDYFSQDTQFPEPSIAPRLHHSQSAPAPPLPRRPSFQRPPVPIKPTHSYPEPPGPHHGYPTPHATSSYSLSPPIPKPSLPPKPDEDEEFKRALELSLQDTELRRREAEYEENEELERALRESLAMADDVQHPPPPPPLPPSSSSVNLHITDNREDPFRASPVSVMAPLESPWEQPPHPGLPAHRKLTPRPSFTAPRPARPPDMPGVDRAFSIRSTVAEMDLPTERPGRGHRHTHSQPQHRHTLVQQHHSAPGTSLAPPPSFHASHSTLDVTHAKPSSMSRSVSSDPILRSQDIQVDHLPSYFPSEKPGLQEIHEKHQEHTPPSQDDDDATPTPSETSQTSTPSTTPGGQHPHAPQRIVPGLPAAPNTSQVVPEELLQGVSMGFGVPSVTGSLKPMQGALPDLISLPYNDRSPFYIAGPSWRSVLKLLARMSATHVEPSIDAITKIKSDMRLRVVVSFVRVHSTSNAWDTILYLTIDHPVPLQAANAARYRNGDSCVLPWSYTLSSAPPMLRDGPDAALSKFYTIPSTQGNLYPTLPITFPDLAMYLASSLDVSRHGPPDAANYHGLNRLAKLIDALYPQEKNGLDEERVGVRQKLKNLVGLGSRPSRNRNAETYDLVTPFVADNYGG